jgi:hypothetical protein
MITINRALYKNDYIIEVYFSDGTVSEIDFFEYTNREGLFSDLEDLNFFRNFEIDYILGTICWKNGLDISPEKLYEKATGIRPSWAVN